MNDYKEIGQRDSVSRGQDFRRIVRNLLNSSPEPTTKKPPAERPGAKLARNRAETTQRGLVSVTAEASPGNAPVHVPIGHP